ncbi:hypothetical protein M406DRAFT_353568 [Cryphonectria parasitica EP155]|uniref:C2H2-type domain-containing protein n=1 Tax=Cryphonectria parasitica (strain ATCC 38755 / EP155) TaxID=660469 RepID=A0A9P4XT97_CRYP1|nr:uncharacterized protein M406DRAFT_353568 [Cryphonectria parasitica EP155]KAF3760837.1 hypothetical protein M406DRAFT_353568 [Cryphonectria parasitica EP155]
MDKCQHHRKVDRQALKQPRFDPEDLACHESSSTPSLERTTSSTYSNDSYCTGYEGGQAMQSGSSCTSGSIHGYDPASSPLAGSSQDNFDAGHNSHSHSTAAIYDQSQIFDLTQKSATLDIRQPPHPPQVVADSPSPEDLACHKIFYLIQKSALLYAGQPLHPPNVMADWPSPEDLACYEIFNLIQKSALPYTDQFLYPPNVIADWLLPGDLACYKIFNLIQKSALSYTGQPPHPPNMVADSLSPGDLACYEIFILIQKSALPYTSQPLHPPNVVADSLSPGDLACYKIFNLIQESALLYAGQPPHPPNVVADSLSPVAQANCKDQYQCLNQGCEAEPFSRHADLVRHYRHVHAPKSQLKQYYCDYKSCRRSKTRQSPSARDEDQVIPFTRKDHYKAHLRDFHLEALPKRSAKDDPDWATEKQLKRTWWRCVRCLKRNWLLEGSPKYVCNCGTELDPEIQNERRRLFGPSSPARSHW